MGLNPDGYPIFVNTLFSCLATLSETHSFQPFWTPPFISKLAPEDRCHLNGLAAVEGKPAYVTAVSRNDAADGWRDHRADGGIVMDVRCNEIVCAGLSMPHSPRWYRNRLWLLEAGSGFLRGLTFLGDYALVGMSNARENRTFSGLALEDHLHERHSQARCGIHIINLQTGNTEHWVRMEGLVEELYDVLALPGPRHPLIIGVQKEEIRKMISIQED